MADHPSLNDRAVAALAEVSAMDRDIGTDDPERHIVWQLKNQACAALSDAFQRAHNLAHLAETVRRDMKAAVADARKKDTTNG
ncbi:hypothetical protein [Stenotrophomonas maltophilia]|uniref:hypothetical protein n=1 Tax=Stenotrophomonas maltophilia TaxID=40324 RepID=UPI000C160166|nr:hypothetical protein [Stenotrophomonas maltophilia]MBH1622411.1 hypothetical protein [Stenotrophomonas maltophilia]